MYLKNIEVLGFKSFANKIVFDFHNGITGIVGPNGSGKSNVADAVRWVLGEQRIKQLRGGTMQDVIFAGTQSRRPQSYASVAITLDNSDRKLPVDFNEVTVTRKLYRSGESEYLLNGSPCRLKDINELFYDTGIGKEGYSIIGQGQIDKILSGKPEERRELFDEAAGIVKFKKRKNQSVKKLEEEESNLTRVTDILNELSRQVGPLEKQSRTARTYLEKKEELKKYDINLFLSETIRQKQRIKEMSADLENTLVQQEEAKVSYEQMKTAYDEIEEEMALLESEADRAKRQQNETRLLRQQLESRIEVLKEQINTVRANDAHYASRMEEVCSQQDESAEEYGQVTELIRSLERQMEDFDSEMQKMSKSRNDAEKERRETEQMLAACRENLISLEKNRAVDSARISGFEKERESLSARLHQAADRCKELENMKDDLGSDSGRLLEKIDGIVRQADICDEAIRSLTEKIQACKYRADELSLRQQKMWQEYHRNESRLDTVKNMAMRYEGYGNSIRKVMEHKSTIPGLYGVVADLIRTNKEYETAIETALGGSVQNIVTDNEQTAKQMIEYLKKNRLGRATFLPLSAMNGRRRQDDRDILQFPGVIGVASDLVETAREFFGLKEHLLGKTYVVGKIDDGIALSRKYRQTLRIVTLEGELLNPGGAMTGGAYKNTSSLLGRQRELEGLEKLLAEQKESLNMIENDLALCKQKRSKLFTDLDQKKEERSALSLEKQKADMALSEEKERSDRLDAQLMESKAQRDLLEKELQKLEKEKEDLTKKEESFTEDTKELSARITFLEQSLSSCGQKMELVEKQIQKHEVSYASLSQKIENARANSSRLEQTIGRLKEQKKELEKVWGETAGEIGKKEAEIENLQKTIADSAQLVTEIEEEIADLKKQREESAKKHRVFLDKRESLTTHMAALDKEAYRLREQVSQMEEQTQTLTDYMWNEYELTYNRALELRDESLTDLTVMKKRIRELKNEIKALGPVNVNAIEEFREVNERYTFLQEQYDDLVEAKKTLEEIIDSLDKSMRTQFAEQFGRINEEFNYVFRQLFGGGKGTLELMEDEDVLEAGIRIIAQPPGKKLQNMMQLSGGEKALTAISLLFAIQNLKPSPFCLLDEIEAALDDNNVNRFAKYLHKLTKDTQFIVITHRRGTMTAADRLYGITMQEKGVSTLVSVDLIEDELEKRQPSAV